MVKDHLPDVNPERIVLDFESAAIQAFKNGFPRAQVSLCQFHFSQSLNRKLNNVGKKWAYENDEQFNILIKCINSLSYVPVGDVIENFHMLCEKFDEDDDAVSQFLSYVETTYIHGQRRRNGTYKDPLFRIQLWDHFEDGLNCLEKTTNCVEGYHNALQNTFRCDHPSMPDFLSGIKKDINIHKFNLRKVLMGEIEPQNRKYQLVAQNLAAAVGSYHTTEDKYDYLRRVAHQQ